MAVQLFQFCTVAGDTFSSFARLTSGMRAFFLKRVISCLSVLSIVSIVCI